MANELVLQGAIEQRIFLIRGQRVMLDKDLAKLYRITTFNLNKAVTRNINRFPEDFMFRLNKREFRNLIFQNGISSWGGTRKLSRVFTEHGKENPWMCLIRQRNIYFGAEKTIDNFKNSISLIDMKKFCLSVFIVGFIFNIVFAAESGPKIEIATQDLDIGDVQKGGAPDFKVEVKNAGTEDLIIESVYSSCGCLEVTDARWPKEAKPEPVIVNPGKSIFIDIRLDTNKIIGAFEKQLYIVSNDPNTKGAIWKIKGVVLDSAKYSSSETAEGSRVEKPTPGSKVIMLFYLPGCNDCKEIKDKFLPTLKKRYGNKIWIEEYNIDNPASFAILLDLQNKYDKKTKKGFFNPRPPIVFAGDKLLYGVKDIKNKLTAGLY